MNKTKIEWTGYTWNPVTGCLGPGGTAEKPNRCAYCYAEKVAKRFIYHDGPDAFAPMFHEDRLYQPSHVKKPAKIFVGSMTDLFGDWVPENWINAVLQQVNRCPQHTFQFLTKNSKRLSEFNPWPSNCWVGTTITNQVDMDERRPLLLKVDAPVRFVSHEPLLGAIDAHLPPLSEGYGNTQATTGINWAIIGALTGGSTKSTHEITGDGHRWTFPLRTKAVWAQGLLDQYQAAGVPVFIKDNLKGLVGCGLKDAPQERPK